MVRIFVYGTLKQGGCRSLVLKGQRFLGDARTIVEYRLYNTGSYPALVEDKDGVQVEGEVWDVDHDCLQTLDNIECVPDLYERKPVALTDTRMNGVETYIYQQSVDGMPDCGGCWDENEHQSRG